MNTPSATSSGAVHGAGLAIAPSAPGRLGEAADPNALLAYLRGLRDWVAQRRRELDGIDAAAQRSSDPDDYIGDITLSMALWQSVSDRGQRLDTLWDAGRADAVTREQMSQVIWGRLASGGPTGATLSLSLVEACRLSDALAAQLRARLSFDPRASDAVVRVAALRAGMERLRELTKQEPSWSAQVELLGSRIDDVAVRAARGGDVDAVLHQLEVDSARAERDLVVTTATKLRRARSAEAEAADLAADRARAASEVAALGHRRTRLLALADRCLAEITPAPRYAVPDVAALGPVPGGRADLDTFTRRLGAVMRAMDVVEQAYGRPLEEYEELVGLLTAYRSMAARAGRTTDAAVSVALARAGEALAAKPCDIAAARLAVTTFRELVRTPVPPTPALDAATAPPASPASSPPPAHLAPPADPSTPSAPTSGASV